jgi:glucosamine-6-phosphate deaminase
MQIHQYQDISLLYQDAANHFIDLISTHKNAVLGLATGSTPIIIYKHLIERYQNGSITFSDVKTFNLDEYVGLDKEHQQSFAYFMQENLFKSINIQQKNIHIPNGNAKDLEKECKQYSKLLKNHPVDIQILGIGSNGHIAFNEPGTPFDSETHIIDLDLKTRIDNARFFNHLNDVPTQAITMGIKDIMQAKKIILIAIGKNKANAVKNMVKGKIDPICPASILQLHPNVHLFLDAESASEL